MTSRSHIVKLPVIVTLVIHIQNIINSTRVVSCFLITPQIPLQPKQQRSITEAKKKSIVVMNQQFKSRGEKIGFHSMLGHNYFQQQKQQQGALTTLFAMGNDDDGFYIEEGNEKEGNELNDTNDEYNDKEYFATCIPGLSSTLAKELIDIGADNVEISGTSGVKFRGGRSEEDIGMKALMYVRTAHRIMELITTSTSYSENRDDYYDDYNGNNEDDYFYNQNPKEIIHDRDSLYNFIQSSITPYHLQNLLGNGKGGLLTLNVSTIMNNQRCIPKDLCHSHYTALTIKNALVDNVRNLRKDGKRPDVDLDDPDVPLMAVLRGVQDDSNRGRSSSKRNYRSRGDRNEYDDDRNNGYDEKTVHVSLYRILHSGGSSLHRRGYRSSSAIHKAAMKESMASGLLLESGWDKLCFAARNKDNLPAVLIDPMCGSGTFCVEAAMIASDYAPGLMRMRCFDNKGNNNSNKQWNPHYIPPVLRWKDSNQKYWKKLVLEARDRASSGMEWMKGTNLHNPEISNCVIMGNELNPGAFELANANKLNSGFDKVISIHEGDCIDWDLEGNVIPGRTIVVSNPPWGLRLTEDIEDSWLSLKAFLRDQCNESEAWVLSGSKSATRYLRMKKTRSFPIKTAGEDLRWIQYHIFKKKSPNE